MAVYTQQDCQSRTLFVEVTSHPVSWATARGPMRTDGLIETKEAYGTFGAARPDLHSVVAVSKASRKLKDASACFPHKHALTQAEHWIRHLYRKVTEQGERFIAPNIVTNDLGEVVLEWWRNEKKLTLYFTEAGNVEYVKVWGEDIDHDMEDGGVALSGWYDLWDWLLI